MKTEQEIKEDSAYHKGYAKGFKIASSISIGIILLFELAGFIINQIND
jgi:hypothetical protein